MSMWKIVVLAFLFSAPGALSRRVSVSEEKYSSAQQASAIMPAFLEEAAEVSKEGADNSLQQDAAEQGSESVVEQAQASAENNFLLIPPSVPRAHRTRRKFLGILPAFAFPRAARALEEATPAVDISSLEGTWSDPEHPRGYRTLLRGRGADDLTIELQDEPNGPVVTLPARVNPPWKSFMGQLLLEGNPPSINIDFSAKGGPSAVKATVSGGKLSFPDGNVWTKAPRPKEPALPDPVKAVIALLEGTWSDPEHPRGYRTLSGSAALGSASGDVTIELQDDPDGPVLKLPATLSLDPPALVIDFSAKGGPSEVKATVDAAAGKLSFPDGNVWTKGPLPKEPALPDPAKAVIASLQGTWSDPEHPRGYRTLYASPGGITIELQDETNTRYLPMTVNGVPVLTKEGQDFYRLDNSALNEKQRNADTPGVAYRFSKDLVDRDDKNIASWGTQVKGSDQGNGWIRVELQLPVVTLPARLEGNTLVIDFSAKGGPSEVKATIDAAAGKLSFPDGNVWTKQP